MVDIIEVIDQLKRFLETDKDTLLGLLVFIIAEIFIINFIIKDNFVTNSVYLMYIYIFMIFITIAIWFWMRKIKIPKNIITIALANFDIISLNIKDGIVGSEKLNLEKEILAYLVDSLRGKRNQLSFEKYIDIINLPPRIKIDDRNAKKMTNKIKANIIIWGTVKYNSKEEVYIEPHFEFYIEPKSLFYTQFKENLLSKEIYQIDLTKEIVSKHESKLSNLIHYLIYVGFLLSGVKLMNAGKFARAHDVLNKSLESLVQIKNPNVTLYDIHLATKFYAGKNLHQWGNYISAHGGKGLKKYDEAIKLFFINDEKVTNNPPKERLFLEHSYLYGVHMLIKEGKLKEAKDKLNKIKNFAQDNPEFLKEEIELLTNKNKKQARTFINLINKKMQSKHLKVDERILQQIGDFFYEHNDYRKAEKYYSEKLKVTNHEIYSPQLFDVADHLKLLKIHIKNLQLLKAQKDLLLATESSVMNKFVKRL